MLAIAQSTYQQMIASLQAVYPLEGCGFLSGRGGLTDAIHPVRNVLQSPIGFRMDPDEQLAALLEIENRGLSVTAIYHSHPGMTPYFSDDDLAGARYWPVVHIVVGLKPDPATGELTAAALGFTLGTGDHPIIHECRLEIV